MDKVRENITNFIDSIQAKYQFQNSEILEFGTGLLDHNKKLFGEKNHFIATDIYETPHTDQIASITESVFQKETFDLVIVSEVLEHVFDHHSAFKTLSEIVKKDGYVLITVPFEYPEHGEDYWRYTGRTLDLLLLRYGFKTVEAQEGFDGEKKTNIFRLAQKF